MIIEQVVLHIQRLSKSEENDLVIIAAGRDNSCGKRWHTVQPDPQSFFFNLSVKEGGIDDQ